MYRRVTAALAALALVLATAGSASAAVDPFTRSWSATDFDGSRLTITFSGGGDIREFSYRDDRATVCGGGAYEATGTGTITGPTMVLDAVGDCVGGGGVAPTWLGFLTFDATLGALFDGTIYWYRGSRAQEAYLGVWKAIDVDGSGLKLTFRSAGQLARDVTFLDDAASSCGGGAFASEGEGIIGSTPGEGRYITLSMSGGCLGGSPFGYAERYAYEVATDSLIGPLGPGDVPAWYTVVWSRG